MEPETPVTIEEQTTNSKQQHAQAIDALVAAGLNREAILALVSASAEKSNREKQGGLPAPPAQADPDFAAREAWAHDGQPIYGELKEFAWAAYRAGKSGDQLTFSRQKDLLYKAVLTFVGPPPLEPVRPEVIAEPVIE